MKDDTDKQQPLPATVRSSLEHVLDHHWDDERADYFDRSPQERAGHVFESLRILQAWLNETPPLDGCGGYSPSIRGEGWSL